MKYYKIEADSDISGVFSSSGVFDTSLKKYNTRHFSVVRPIKGEVLEPLTVILNEVTSFYNVSNKLTDILNFGFPVKFTCISNRVRKLFEFLNLPLEYFKIQIKGKNIDILEGYQLAKLNAPPLFCVDEDKSIFFYDEIYKSVGEDIVSRIDKLYFDESKIPKGTDILVLGFAELFPYYLWVSEKVKLQMEERSLTGFIFTEVEEYQQK